LKNVRLFCRFGRGKEAVLGLQDISYDVLCSLYDCLTRTGEFLLKFDFGLKLLRKERWSFQEPHDRKRARLVSKPNQTDTKKRPPSLYFLESLPASHNMSKKHAAPDAWDDDWESQADKAESAAEVAKVEEQVKVTKAERLAKHAETNRKIWKSA
jgi:hypothetical protein